MIGNIKVVEFLSPTCHKNIPKDCLPGQKPSTSVSRGCSRDILKNRTNSAHRNGEDDSGMRSYESAQKLIQTLDRMTETAIQDLGPGAIGGVL